MYLRYKQTKTTPVLQLVYSYRNEDGDLRQKILPSLGKLEIPEDLLKSVEFEVKDILSNSKEKIEERLSEKEKYTRKSEGLNKSTEGLLNITKYPFVMKQILLSGQEKKMNMKVYSH